MSRPVQDFIVAEDLPATDRAKEQLLAGEMVFGLEVRFRCRDGSERWLAANASPLPARQLTFAVLRDITERRVFEERLVRYQNRLRALSSELFRVEEKQRRNLATLLHDGLAQDLFAIRTQIELLREPAALGRADAITRDVLSQLDAAIQQTRNLTFELVPPSLHDVGLPAALEWLASTFTERTGLKCDLREDGPPVELGDDERTMFYQSVRELLGNVLKHAHAGRAVIAVARRPELYQVTVADDGRGIADQDSERLTGEETGFGLFSIRERFESQGGSFALESAEGRGCRVTIALPTGSPERTGTASKDGGAAGGWDGS
jgi:signal transduction histidine kinase